MIEAVMAALAFGTVWFWTLLILSIILITAFVENERGVGAFICLVLTIGILSISFPLIREVLHHPGKTLLYVLAYFVAGTIWGVVKWFLYVRKQLEAYQERKANTMNARGIKEMTPALAVELRSYASVPQVRENKSKVMFWMTYWPFSGLWTLINDPVRRIFKFIYTSIQEWLQGISNRAFKGVQEELKIADTVPKPRRD